MKRKLIFVVLFMQISRTRHYNNFGPKKQIFALEVLLDRLPKIVFSAAVNLVPHFPWHTGTIKY